MHGEHRCRTATQQVKKRLVAKRIAISIHAPLAPCSLVLTRQQHSPVSIPEVCHLVRLGSVTGLGQLSDLQLGIDL